MQHFKSLHMYQLAKEVCLAMYSISNEWVFSKDRDLKSQIRRACVSTLSNIAEGYRKRSKKEEVRYMEIARDSACEVLAQWDLAQDLQYVDNAIGTAIDDKIEHLISMISKYIQSLDK